MTNTKTIDIAVDTKHVIDCPCRIHGNQQDVAVIVQAPEADEYLVWYLGQDTALLETQRICDSFSKTLLRYVQDNQVMNNRHLRATIFGGVFRGVPEQEGAQPKVYDGARSSIERILQSMDVTDIQFQCQNPDAKGFLVKADRLKYTCKEILPDNYPTGCRGSGC